MAIGISQWAARGFIAEFNPPSNNLLLESFFNAVFG